MTACLKYTQDVWKAYLEHEVRQDRGLAGGVSMWRMTHKGPFSRLALAPGLQCGCYEHRADRFVRSRPLYIPCRYSRLIHRSSQSTGPSQALLIAPVRASPAHSPLQLYPILTHTASIDHSDDTEVQYQQTRGSPWRHDLLSGGYRRQPRPEREGSLKLRSEYRYSHYVSGQCASLTYSQCGRCTHARRSLLVDRFIRGAGREGDVIRIEGRVSLERAHLSTALRYRVTILTSSRSCRR